MIKTTNCVTWWFQTASARSSADRRDSHKEDLKHLAFKYTTRASTVRNNAVFRILMDPELLPGSDSRIIVPDLLLYFQTV